MNARDIVEDYFKRGLSLVFWPPTADWKGPREPNWLTKHYTIDDYHDGDRVGIMHGVEMVPGQHVIDVDIDWADGIKLATAFLPPTAFVWGRTSKAISHCLYLSPDVIPMYAYKDVGKNGATLIEFRSDKHQCMAPPSIWEKDGVREPLAFVTHGDLMLVESAGKLKQRVCLGAITMLLGRHFGTNGFGHEARLCWAGFLLRAGISIDDLVTMGEALSVHCNNREVVDVKRTLDSTASSLQHDGKKVKGGPALAKLLGEHGKAVVARINEWIGRDSDFIRNANGIIIAKHPENVRKALEVLGHELSYNEFADKLLVDGQPLEDKEMTAIWMEIDAECRFQPPEAFLERCVKHMAWQNSFHPVKQYLDSLHWDGVARIDEWLIVSAKVEDSLYTRAISSIMLIAAVRRIRSPGCKYDEMVVWESHQGGDKSSAAQALCPNAAWFSDDLALNLKSQQLIEATLGKWIIEASDLAGKRKTEIEALKAMLSRAVDGPARMAYAHFPVERPRHFILIGTTNSATYLTDPTGARRFWPMAVQRFNVTWIKDHRDQLWAEACVREAKGESIRLAESLWPLASQMQEKRREIDPWEATLRAFMLGVEKDGDEKRRASTNELWNALIITLDKRDRYGALRISEIMQRLGFKRTTVRPPKEPVQSGYVTDNEEMLHIHDEREPGEDVVEPPPLRLVKDEDTPF